MRRTFILQLYDRPLRRLPHQHTCPKCEKEYWCERRDLWNACPGHIKARPHEKACKQPRDPFRWGQPTAKGVADDIAALINAMSTAQPTTMYLNPYLATKLGIEFTQELDGVTATSDGDGIINITSTASKPLVGRHLDYIFVDDPIEDP